MNLIFNNATNRDYLEALASMINEGIGGPFGAEVREMGCAFDPGHGTHPGIAAVNKIGNHCFFHHCGILDGRKEVWWEKPDDSASNHEGGRLPYLDGRPIDRIAAGIADKLRNSISHGPTGN
jgi:hypothetical protein